MYGSGEGLTCSEGPLPIIIERQGVTIYIYPVWTNDKGWHYPTISEGGACADNVTTPYEPYTQYTYT